MTAYHIEAAIAGAHASAPSVEETDWRSIVSLYDRLMEVAPSPVVALSRAIAIGERDGAERGLEELHGIADRERLADYPFYPAAMGELELRRGDLERAREHFESALGLARNPTERRFLGKRLACTPPPEPHRGAQGWVTRRIANQGGAMKIGIIGAGHIGGTLARRLTALGHEVSIANSRGPKTLDSLAKETGAKPVTIEQAARAGDVVIIAIPEKNVSLLPPGLFDGVPAEVVVVDTGNYYPQQRDGRIDPIEKGKSESRWVSDQLGRPVVKTFNNIYARSLLEGGKPKGGGRIALPVAGDDSRAKDVVIRLLDELGFDGVDGGSLDESWRQQPATPVYGAELDVAGVRAALGKAKRERSAEFRAGGESSVTTRA